MSEISFMENSAVYFTPLLFRTKNFGVDHFAAAYGI
jgi:hypothetical protein